MEKLQIIVLAVALLLSTTNIFVFSWANRHEQHRQIGIWLIRLVGAFPGLLLSVWAIHALATNRESTLGMVLVTAGMLLVAGTIQLLSLLPREQAAATEGS